MKRKKDVIFIIACLLFGLLLVCTDFFILKLTGIITIIVVLIVFYNYLCINIANDAYMKFYEELREEQKKNSSTSFSEIHYDRTIAEKAMKVSDEILQYVHLQFGSDAQWRLQSDIYNDLAASRPVQIEVVLPNLVFICNICYDTDCNITAIVPLSNKTNRTQENKEERQEEDHSQQEKYHENSDVDIVDIPKPYVEKNHERIACNEADLKYFWKIREDFIKKAQQVAESGDTSFVFTLEDNGNVSASHIKQLIDDDNNLQLTAKAISDNELEIAFEI